MFTLNQLRIYFWSIDPGYFHLKHAAKTILAILISLWFVRDEATLTKVLTGLASGASMQGIVDKSLYRRMAHVVIFDTLYFLSLALGLSIRNVPHWTAIALVVLGFAVNYIRRFGLDKSMSPMVVWVLCFLATILPVTGSTEVWTLAYGIGVGFLVSAIVIIFILPENYPRLFVNNSNQVFQCLAQGLREMRRYVFIGNERVNFRNVPFVSIKTMLDQLLESNQTIQQSAVFASEQKQVNHILMHQYALVNAYSLVIEVFHSLWFCKHQLSRPGALALSQMCKEFAHLFSTTRIRNDYWVDAQYTPILLPNLAEKLGKVSLTEPAMIMALLNFKLGFDLLIQHEIKLLRGVDDA